MTIDVKSLHAAISAYLPFDEIDSGYKTRALNLIESSGAVSTNRKNFMPGHFTATAVIVSADGQNVAMISHAVHLAKFPPGGHVEPEDLSLEAANRREAAEEVGIVNMRLLQSTPIDLDIHTIPASAKKAEPEHEHFDVRYFFQAEENIDLLSSDDDGVTAVEWMPIIQLHNLLPMDLSNVRWVTRVQRWHTANYG